MTVEDLEPDALEMSSSPMDSVKNSSSLTSAAANSEFSSPDVADPDTTCGIGCFKPKWLQRFATSRVYLGLFSMNGVITGSYYTYRVAVVSTLEKRYAMKSKTTGTIMMMDELTPLLLGTLVGYIGGRTHRPRLFGIGTSLSVLCCLFSALPYFIYGSVVQLHTSTSNATKMEMCDNSLKEHCEEDGRPPTFAAVILLMSASFLKGFGTVVFSTAGISYLDDNSKKRNTSMYMSIVASLRLLGPLMGFVLASACLKLYENPFVDPGYGPDDPRWIGCWWLGFLIQGLMMLVFSLPVILFPRRLPGYKLPTASPTQNQKLQTKIKDLLVCLMRILKNPIYITLVCNTILGIIANVGFYVNSPKYMEHQFRLSASDASLYSGPPGIGSIMVSMMAGGYLMWRYKPSARLLAGAMVLVEIVTVIGSLLLMIPQCESIQMTNSGLQLDGSLILNNDCNAGCNCTTKEYNPVCGPDGITTYFSPCHAGCTELLNETYINCLCVSNGSTEYSNSVTKGVCKDDNCWSQAILYIIQTPIQEFIINFLRSAFTVMVLRSIKPEDKSMALGTFETLICLFGFVPFLVIFGSLVDNACLVWEKTCGQTGNCWFYDVPKFNFLIHGVRAAITSVSVVSLIVLFYLSPRMGDLYEENTKADEEEKKNETELSNFANGQNGAG